jgi:retinoic acid induced 16-like protein/uncharacterized protein DUF5917
LLQSDTIAADSIRLNLQKLTNIIEDESRSPHPHPCLSFVAASNIYQVIGRIGAVAQNESVIREAVAFFAALVDSDEEEFLTNRRFAKALMMFVDRTCGSGNLYVGEETECEIIELLFGIAAKIRLEPELLTVWFNTSAARPSASEEHNKKVDFVGLTSKDDFPLCYQLIDHVHHEGRMGDFARTGLLYIFETASKSPKLEQWITGSDLPTLMASGLGALYSQLSRKLSIIHPKSELPVILQLSDYSELQAPPEAESLFSDYLQTHLETFLSYLTFWQDVLEHCNSIEVKQTLLDHFQILFLQQLLYPSLLESSDTDGGSSVAVLTYLRRILEVVDHPDFVHLILQYLLALPEPTEGLEASVASLHAMRKRKSLLLLSKAMEEEDEEASPSLFNLADLLQNSIRSSNPQTVIAACKLLGVLLDKDHPYAVGPLLRSERVTHDTPQRTHGALNAELEAYVSVAEDIAGESGMDDAYESHVEDAQLHVELHCCSASLLTLESLGIPMPANPLDLTVLHPRAPLEIHALQPGDRLFEHLLTMLSTFLTNNVEVNLSLTEVILTLASCPQLRLEDWMAVNPHHYSFTELTVSSEGGNNPLKQILAARRVPTWSSAHIPSLLQAFLALSSQIQLLKSTIPSLTQLINTRKQAFRLHDEISSALVNQPPPPSIISPLRPSDQPTTAGAMSPPPKPTPAAQSFSSRLFGSPTPDKSRSRSPRGRTPGRQYEQGITSSPSPHPRSYLASPARGSPMRASPSRVQPSPARGTRIGGHAGPVVVGHSPEDLLSDIIEGANSEVLARKVKFPLNEATLKSVGGELDAMHNRPSATESTGEIATMDTDGHHDAADGEIIVSLSHVLTNIVILQEFILELAAVMQVRASLFGEVKFAELTTT